jgi:hypothetical protein
MKVYTAGEFSFTQEEIEAAIKVALCQRGPHKGQLKATPPPWSQSLGRVAWEAITSHADPYKMHVFSCMVMNARERAFYDVVDRLIGQLPPGVIKGADRDRAELERLGVW